MKEQFCLQPENPKQHGPEAGAGPLGIPPPDAEQPKHQGRAEGNSPVEPREKLREYHKHYYHKNREKRLQQHKRYREKNKENRKEQDARYYEANRERLLEQSRLSYQKNKEKRKEQRRLRYRRHKEQAAILVQREQQQHEATQIFPPREPI